MTSGPPPGPDLASIVLTEAGRAPYNRALTDLVGELAIAVPACHARPVDACQPGMR